MRILYVTRKHPPMIGGMERYSADLIEHSPADVVHRIVLGRLQQHLIWWVPFAWVRTCYCLFFQRPDIVHVTDSLMAVLLLPLVRLFRVPCVATAHALDVVWRPPLYQWLLRRILPRLSAIVSVSNPTVEYLLARGVARDRIVVIPNGIVAHDVPADHIAREFLNVRFGIPEKAFILLSVCRLMPRKNIAWFVREVMPHLPERVYLLIVGSGSEAENIQRAIRERGLSRRVVATGRLSDAERDHAYGAADLFIMPNRTVPSDAEGFGIVAIEAASHGIPVLTTGIEGIQEAIADGENGIFFPEQNAAAAVQRIQELLDQPEALRALSRRAREYTNKKFSWDVLTQQYRQLYQRVIAARHPSAPPTGSRSSHI